MDDFTLTADDFDVIEFGRPAYDEPEEKIEPAGDDDMDDDEIVETCQAPVQSVDDLVEKVRTLRHIIERVGDEEQIQLARRAVRICREYQGRLS